MSSDDECDYMSDDFLAKCIEGGKGGDIRPGLIHDRSKQRQVDIEKRKAQTDEENRKRHKPHAYKEVERREEGLREAISTDNKGFALLQKMGYKPGNALGKSGKGLVEPVSIEVKSGRGGLGRETAMKEVAEAKSHAIQRWRLKRKEEGEIGTKDYRLRIAAEARKRQAEGDLRVSQKACYHLDDTNGYDAPLEKWFWPEIKTNVDEESSSESEDFDDEADKDDEPDEDDDVAPGSKHQGKDVIRRRHKGGCSKSSRREKIKEEKDDGDDELQPEEKLEVLTEYLRKTYFFCTWCGTKFEGKEDLEANCPGTTREDH
ncbi:G patch domain-containing protein 11 [Ischnura elegans]|uniref:G patch domain-containing protein 11 n=1 Tax=Ischnura elegans TaxID=197161 RepID=UPI001ED8987F|nr:G patch domain-containing protein 11 [Ischnura elegans]